MNEQDRLAGLEERLARLENRLAGLEACLNRQPPAVSAPPAVAPPSILPAAPPSVEAERPAAPRGGPWSGPAVFPDPPLEKERPSARAGELERRIGRIWLPRLAALLVSLSAVFLLVWAYDRLGPAVRVGLGLLGGAVLMAAGLWAQRKLYRPLAAGLTAAGSVVFYLCLYAGHVRLALIPHWPALGFMALTTAATLLIALRFSQPFVAAMGVAGGFLTPLLLGGIGAEPGYWWSLLGYLAILDLGLLLLAHTRRWPSLHILSFLATQAYLLSYCDRLLSLAPGLALAVTGLFFALFSLAGSYRHFLRRLRGDGWDLALGIANGAALLGWVLAVFYGHDGFRDWPGLGALAAAAVHLALGLGLLARDKKNLPLPACYLGLAFAFATMAAPLQLKGNPLAFSWLAEAVFLIWLGRRLNSRGVRGAGLLVYALALCIALYLTAALMTGTRGGPRWFPAGLLPLLGTAVASLALIALDRDPAREPAPSEGFVVLASLLCTAWLSCQWWLGFEPIFPWAARSWLHFGLFVLWAGEALLLVRRSARGPMSQVAAGLVLIALANKVFFDGALHYLGLSDAWFDGYLCQGLGAVALAVLTGRLWPASPGAKGLRAAADALGACGLLLLLTLEYLTWPVHWGAYARGLGLSALWVLYAGAAIAAGLLREARAPRLLGLALLGLALCKLFLFDLHWTGLYRVLSFLLAGLVLFALGALYQRWERIFIERDGQDRKTTAS